MQAGRTSRAAFVLLLAAAIGCRAPAAAPAPTTPALPVSAQVGGTSIVAIAPPAQECCPKQTLPQFLGITGVVHGVHGLVGRLRNRLGGIWPGLEAKPEVLALADPANLESPNPAVAAAAGVKAEEDAAAQKAKAIAYLASVGCAGCYPGIEEALLAALDDCSEIVRFETAKALRSTAALPCKNCCRSACCGPQILEKLQRLAYELDEQGCYVEPSDRVRRMSRLALANCACVPPKPAAQQQRLPLEGPGAEDVVPGPVAWQAAPPTGGSAAIGSGVAAGASAMQSASADVQPTSFQDVVQPSGSRQPGGGSAAMQVMWEVWTARPEDFVSRHDALAAMTLARTQLLSSQPGQRLPPQVRKASHPWTDPAALRSPNLAQAVAHTPVGGVSHVVEDHTGWHLVRVQGRRPAAEPSPPEAGGWGRIDATPARPGSAALPTATLPHSPPIVRLPDCNCR